MIQDRALQMEPNKFSASGMDISDDMMEGFNKESADKNRQMSPSLPTKKNDSDDMDDQPMVFESDH